MNRCIRRWILAFVLLGLTLASTVATAEDGPVLPPTAHPHGRSYSEWAAAWWTWALSQPKITNPALDPNGAFCANGQEGKVWFLAGMLFGGTATRSCTVSPGTALLFPVVNLVSCGVPPDPATEEEVRNAVSIVPEQANGLNAMIDGIPVSDIQGRYFEGSALFEVALPEDTLFGLDAGTVVAPCAGAGYYLMVPPLPPGEHTIEFGGSLTGFSTQVTYHITVAR